MPSFQSTKYKDESIVVVLLAIDKFMVKNLTRLIFDVKFEKMHKHVCGKFIVKFDIKYLTSNINLTQILDGKFDRV